MEEWLGFALASVIGLGVALLVSSRPPLSRFRSMILVAVLVRMASALLYREVMLDFYGGGDALDYFDVGSGYARDATRGDFSFLSSTNWLGGHWWGTQFVYFLSALAVKIVGPSMRGAFVLFSVLSLVGMIAIGRTYLRVTPGQPNARILYWLFFWPSLCFWPSCIGKEALITFSLGCFVAGYASQGMKKWSLRSFGLGGMYAVRPHVAAVVLMAAALGAWTGRGERRRGQRLFWGVLATTAAVVVALAALRGMGVEDVSLTEITATQERYASQTLTGGGQIDALGGWTSGLPLAYVNMLGRPFLWEAHNPLALAAATELIVLWALMWRRARSRKIVATLRENPLLRFGVFFVLVYTLLIGTTMFNLGIVARQRVLAWPFLFCVVEGLASSRRVRRTVRGAILPRSRPMGLRVATR